MITLDTLKKEIEEKGYKVVHRKGEVSWLQCYMPYDIDKHNKFISFSIELIDKNQIASRDGNEQVPRVKFFPTPKELLEHIKLSFPIS